MFKRDTVLIERLDNDIKVYYVTTQHHGRNVSILAKPAGYGTCRVWREGTHEGSFCKNYINTSKICDS